MRAHTVFGDGDTSDAGAAPARPRCRDRVGERWRCATQRRRRSTFGVPVSTARELPPQRYDWQTVRKRRETTETPTVKPFLPRLPRNGENYTALPAYVYSRSCVACELIETWGPVPPSQGCDARGCRPAPSHRACPSRPAAPATDAPARRRARAPDRRAHTPTRRRPPRPPGPAARAWSRRSPERGPGRIARALSSPQ